MIDLMIKWSLHNRLFVLVGAAVLMAWGGMQAQKMPIDIFPDLTAPTVTVITEAHGMAPEETERRVTFPLESALNGASGVRRVRSATSVGLSVIWVEFDWGMDIYTARQIVTEKLQLASPSLPPELSPPVLAPISSIMGEILFIGLRSERVDPQELRTIADWEIRRRLLAVPGVSQVIPMGGSVKQLQVLVRPDDLAEHQVTLNEVVDAVKAANENSSAGFYEGGGQEYLIYGIGRVDNAEQISQSVIRSTRERALRIMDVADVKIGSAIKRGDASINARPSIILGIQKQPKTNTLELSEKINHVLDDIERRLPAEVHLERRLLRQADFIDFGIRNVTHALRDGSLLVILIVGLFLLSSRATLITALAIPLSLVISALTLLKMGASLNTMTLGGMAIAVGALVDDAIIDVENVARRLRERRGQRETMSVIDVVFEASKEIRSSIVFATLIIILVFLPIFFLTGVEGRLLEPLGLAYVISLAASLLVALTVTPVLCSLLLPHSSSVKIGQEPKFLKWLRSRYESLLDRALSSWRSLAMISAIGFIIAAFCATQAGRTFLPNFNEGALTISVVTFPGTSLEQSNQIGQQVESILLAFPEVASTARRTGRAELDEHAQGIHASEIDVKLEMKQRSAEEFLSAMRSSLSVISGVNMIIGQPISHRIDHMISGTRASIAIKIFGPQLGELRRLAEQAQAQIRGLNGVVDLAIEEQANLPVVNLRFNREALAKYHLQVRDVAESIETAFYGQKVSQLLINGRSLDLIVRYPDESRQDLDTIKQTMIATPRGAWVPLEALAEIRRERGPNQISHENGQRKIVVMCNVGEGADLGSVINEIRHRILTKLILPEEYYVEYGGQFEAATQAAQTLFIVFIGVILGIFLLLYVALSSGRDSILVMLNLPLALIGGVIGVFMSNGVISIASLIGFIALFGIATRNGIMLITHISHLLKFEGENDPRSAVIRGASERLSPILMTAMASGLGLLPLALASGEPGSEIQAPMAVVILFGLLSSTVLNMIVVPAMVLRFGSISRAA